eukprot:6207286-Pleurochrysis_carterae.AAC.2
MVGGGGSVSFSCWTACIRPTSFSRGMVHAVVMRRARSTCLPFSQQVMVVGSGVRCGCSVSMKGGEGGALAQGREVRLHLREAAGALERRARTSGARAGVAHHLGTSGTYNKYYLLLVYLIRYPVSTAWRSRVMRSECMHAAARGAAGHSISSTRSGGASQYLASYQARPGSQVAERSDLLEGDKAAAKTNRCVRETPQVALVSSSTLFVRYVADPLKFGQARCLQTQATHFGPMKPVSDASARYVIASKPVP